MASIDKQLTGGRVGMGVNARGQDDYSDKIRRRMDNSAAILRKRPSSLGLQRSYSTDGIGGQVAQPRPKSTGATLGDHAVSWKIHPPPGKPANEPAQEDGTAQSGLEPGKVAGRDGQQGVARRERAMGDYQVRGRQVAAKDGGLPMSPLAVGEIVLQSKWNTGSDRGVTPDHSTQGAHSALHESTVNRNVVTPREIPIVVSGSTVDPESGQRSGFQPVKPRPKRPTPVPFLRSVSDLTDRHSALSVKRSVISAKYSAISVRRPALSGNDSPLVDENLSFNGYRSEMIGADSPTRCRHSCQSSIHTGHVPASAPAVDKDIFLFSSAPDTLPTPDLGGRHDTLHSPRVSPVPWLNQSVPQLVVTSSLGDGIGPRVSSCSSCGSSEGNLLTVPAIKPLRRNSSGSLHSASDESDTETSPPVPRRGRRQAIFDSKSLGLTDGDLSPTNSCDENENNSQPSDRRRKRSSVDLGINYPGDIMVHQRHTKKVLIKRNTIADFANTKAYQASTASLISEQDTKKRQSSFSLFKMIDKKSHRSKEHVSCLSDVLLHMKPSEFKDTHLTCYKDLHWSELIASKDNGREAMIIPEVERKRREAVWELFKSECVFLIDHVMVLKHSFLEPMKNVQVEGHLMFAEPQDLFGNLDELCYVSYTFCHDFISLLLKDAHATDFGRTEVLIRALERFCKHTRDGEVYHDYCLNYSKAMTYLETLRRNDDFAEFEKWCEQDLRCHRLQLTDLLISPMQHCTKVPLLLNNIRRYTEDPDERQQLTDALEKLETSLKSLEAKMKWLKNFERVQEIQQQILWQPISELDPRAFIPEFLKSTLNRQPCERLLASPKRQLLHEGPLVLLEISKTVDMYMFLFDDILLLTRVKKPPRKHKAPVQDGSNISLANTDGAVFVVHRQPIALDRFTLHDVRPPDAAGLWWEYFECGVHVTLTCDQPCHSYKDTCSLPPHCLAEEYSIGGRAPNLLFGCLSAASSIKNAFVLVQISRFQQVIGVYTLQAPTEAAKVAWLSKLHESQDKYRDACKRRESFTAETSSLEQDDPPKRRSRGSKYRKRSEPKDFSSQQGSSPSGGGMPSVPNDNQPSKGTPMSPPRDRSASDSAFNSDFRTVLPSSENAEPDQLEGAVKEQEVTSAPPTIVHVHEDQGQAPYVEDNSFLCDAESDNVDASVHSVHPNFVSFDGGNRQLDMTPSTSDSKDMLCLSETVPQKPLLSPSRAQRLTMLKVIHEKSQSIDTLDSIYV